MALQTEYRDNLAPAVAGAQATMIPATLISRNVETEGGIGFGRGVSQGETDKGVVLGGTAFVGITLLDRSAMGPGDTFREGDSARVMTKGDIWVVAEDAVEAGDPVHMTATGGFSNTGGTAIANARWDTSTTADGLAVVRLG